MEKHIDRILWSILLLAIGIGIFVIGKPAYQQILKSSTQNLSHSMKQWEGATFVNEQFVLGNTGSVGSDDLSYDGNFDSHQNTGDWNTHLFNVTATNGVYHMSSDSSMPVSGYCAGFNVQYKNDGSAFDTGDFLNASVQVKGVGHLDAFGFEAGQNSLGNSQQINTHGQWQTLTYQSPSKAVGDIKSHGLVFYLYYQPNTDLYVRNVDAQIH